MSVELQEQTTANCQWWEKGKGQLL